MDNNYLKYNLYKNIKNIKIIVKLEDKNNDSSLFLKNNINNFNNNVKILEIYDNINNEKKNIKYNLYFNKKIITFVIFNNNNYDLLLLNLLNLNNLKYQK